MFTGIDFSMEFWNCSDSIVFWNCSDSIVFWNCSDSVVFFVFHFHRHDITEILLKVALNTITSPYPIPFSTYCLISIGYSIPLIDRI